MLPSPPEQRQSTQPVSLSTRIQSLDVLRGIAVLAALFVSIWIFGGFSDNQQKQLLITSKGWNYRVFGAVDLLLNGKMRAMIAIVFGAAMVLFLSKETEPGKQPAGDIFIKRQLWLIIFGLVNAVLLLWTNDLLFHLGVLGILLFPFFRINSRGLLIAALFTTLVYCGKNYWSYSDQQSAYRKYVAVTALEKKFEQDSITKAKTGLVAKKDTLKTMQKRDKEAWLGILAGKKINPKADDPTNKAMRSGSYGKVWNFLLPKSQARQADWTYKLGVWDLACMMFLGMLLYKIGFFNSRFSNRRYLIVAFVAVAGGLLLGWYRLNFEQISLRDYEKFVKTHSIPNDLFFPIERAAIALAYVSLTMALLSTRILAPIWSGLAAVGKLALTNYLVQTIICTIFFYGYGMGYFGRLSQFQLYFFAAEVVLVQIAFSVLWLRAYNYGPAEWLLRRLSAGKWLPKRFRKPSDTEPVIPVLS